jgi:pimeloyl-ACP methyl ester carboxylesterase
MSVVPHVPPLWRESRVALEAARLLRSPVWRGEGYWTSRAGIRANVGCSQDACERLEERLETLAARTGDRVAIIGQSRGGVLARVVAYRRPDLVSGIVTLGAPTVSMLKVHPLVLLQVGLVGALGTGRVPGLMSLRCLRGACCETFREDLPAPFPDGVRYVSVYSRSDGIVDWRACLDPAADELVEVHVSHCGMAVSEQVYRLLAGTLAQFADEDPPLPLAA